MLVEVFYKADADADADCLAEPFTSMLQEMMMLHDGQVMVIN